MMKNRAIKIEDFEKVLEIYGANSSRWPSDNRDQLVEFLDSNDEAMRLFKEAQALDHVLDFAPSMALSDDLRTRILAKQGYSRGGSDADQQISEAADSKVVEFNRYSVRHNQMGLGRNIWRETSLLAACLVLGFYLGITGLTDFSFNNDVDMASLGSEFDALIPSIDLEEGTLPAEDLL